MFFSWRLNSVLTTLAGGSLLLIRSVDASPVVTGGNGVTYHGITESSGLESFQNIPFGQDTSGEGRFAPPRPYVPPQNAVINATVPGPACPQQKVPIPAFPLFSNVTNPSEDCLNLRITRPGNTTEESNLPVMVYIYGGGESIGQIYDHMYTPDGLVLSGKATGNTIIYVAINYRVNMFGFAASETLKSQMSLNVGLLDQRLGLEWVYNNIQYFGGNPHNITIFGESDGATDVGLQLTAFGGRGKAPFNRAIMQSGSAIGVPVFSGNKSYVAFDAVANATNCTSDDGAKVLSCLRAIPMDDLISAVLTYEYIVAPGFGFDVFVPVIDDVFVPKVPSQLIASGSFYKNVDVIVGWNYDDGSLFAPYTAANETDIVEFLQSTWPNLSTDAVTQILDLYPIEDFVNVTIPPVGPYFFQASRIFRDLRFTCGQLDMSNKLSCQGASAYIYVLNETVFGAYLPSFFGVPHISDVPFVFDEVKGVDPNATTADVSLGLSMSSSWAAFGSKGAPGSVTDWPVAYSNLPTDIKIKVFGGESSGVWNISTAPGEENTLERCRYVLDIFDQLQT